MSEEKPPQSWCLNLGGTSNPVAMEFRWIPPGWIRIGQRGQSTREEPPTWIRIQRGFYMGVLPVTVQQYNALVEKGQQKQEDDHLPATDVSWHQAQSYCREISEQCAAQLLIHGLPYAAALPTEVQWEYACRAGTDTEIVFGDGIRAYQENVEAAGEADRTSMVWYDEPSGNFEPRDPNSGLPNPFGLRDTHGNVWEWCQDRWDEQLLRRYHQGIDGQQAIELSEQFGDREDHGGKGEYRTRRGGSFYYPAGGCRAAFRRRDRAGISFGDSGLRVCLVPLPDVRPAVSQKGMPADASQAGQRRRQAVAGKAKREEAGIQPAATAQPERDFSALIPPEDAVVGPLRTLQSIDGTTWTSNHGPCDWQQLFALDLDDRKGITKLVVGTPPIQGEEEERIQSLSLPDSLESLFPNLTHLYLWQIESLQTLPRLPANLQVIDLRGCRNLQGWGDQKNCHSWGASLEELFLDDTQLAGPCWQENLSFPQLIELSIRGCANWPCLTLKKLLRRSPKLRYLDASDCPQIEELEVLPDSLRVLKLNSCSNLQLLPESFPAPLRRLELRAAEKLTDLPLISSRLDYLDLRQTSALKQLPTFECLTIPLQKNEPHPLEYWVSPDRVWSDREWIVQPSTPRPRTLYLFGSGIEIPFDLKGADADSNVSEEVFTRLKESDFEAFRELKVILLGNGRSGKSSFAKVWKLGEFDANQSSTHGIQLWTLDLELSRIDDDPSEDGDKPFARINVWDFAGQDLYHGTHRLFMQSDAIFVILDGPADLPGSDDASDEIERQREQDEEEIGVGDRPRSPEYWYKMITSLGSNPHTHAAPPVLLIRSKTDRRAASRRNPLAAHVKEVQFSSKIVAEALTKLQKPDPKELSFDHKSPQGLTATEEEHFLQFREAIQWIRQQCRVLLGPFDRHKMPKSTIRVIRELRKLSDENDRVYRAANPDAYTGMGTQHRCEVPHPFLSYDEFHGMVKKECKHYALRPDLLLKSLHSRGLVYYDKRLLPDSVILDQRWAIRGIYTLFDRFDEKSLIEQLHRSHGVVSKQRLQECWERRNFNAVDQELFLNFMESCGMIFQLLTPEEALSGSPVFSIPSFMPKQPDPELRNSLENLQSVSVTIPNVNEAEIRSLISKLGGEWSRSMAAYRWGCIKQSENFDGSWFWMHWLDEPNKMEYGFNLRFRFPGQRDQELEAVVRKTVGEVFRASRGWGDADLEKVWPTSSSASESSVSLEVLKSPGISDETIRSHKRVGRRIGISYAGCDKDAAGNPIQNENFWIGEIPSRLGKLLENQRNQLGLLAVDYYGSPDAPNMSWKMIDNLAKSDIFLGFFSKKYFESPWCMVELYQLFDREPRGEFPKDQVLFIDLVQEAHEPGSSYRRRDWLLDEWNAYWSQRRVVWETDALKGIAIGGMTDLERQNRIDSWLNSIYLEVTRWVNVVREVDRISLKQIFQAVKTYSDAIEVRIPSGNGSAGKISCETVLSEGVSQIFNVVEHRFFE